MTIKQFIKAVGTVAALGTTVLAGVLLTSPRLNVRARDKDHSESRIEQGFDIAPVKLDLKDRNHALVGMGSYIVNGIGFCNTCHNPGPGNNQFLKGGNPYFGQPVQINTATYLGGGRDFGPTVPGSFDVLTRNLTPNSSGFPEGGHTFPEFHITMRTGIDLEHLHPPCPPGTINTSCVPKPFDGKLLQFMPWPTQGNMTDHDLKAVYEYLSAIPCVAGPAAPSPLHHDCNMSARAHLEIEAEDDDLDNQSRIEKGFDIAPVKLNLHGKDRDLVGLGSYWVNGPGSCNGCHNPGPGENQFVTGGNPYFGQPEQINKATYLGGGRDFGPLIPGSADIIARNLTPDKTGLPEGGHTYAEFVQIMRTGVDMDHLHPTCPTGTVNTGCIPAPFNGSLLQIMPWFSYNNLTDRDLRAIYEYLSAIPCVAGPPAPNPLHNNC